MLELLLELHERGLWRCECFSRYAPDGRHRTRRPTSSRASRRSREKRWRTCRRGRTLRDDASSTPGVTTASRRRMSCWRQYFDKPRKRLKRRSFRSCPRIYTAVGRDPSISAAEAQYVLGLAGRLTYRRLVALSVLSRHDSHEDALIDATVNHKEGTAPQDPGHRVEIVDLINQQVVGAGDEFRVAAIGDPWGRRSCGSWS